MLTRLTSLCLYLAATSGVSASEGCQKNIQFSAEYVSSEMVQNSVRQEMYEVAYAVTNKGSETIIYLKIAIAGRNANSEYVELDDSFVFLPSTLPHGLKSNETIKRRHGLIPTNQQEDVVTIELSVIEARCG